MSLTLTDSVEIRTTPEKVFDFFLHIEENHKAWHPDHMTVRWIKEKPLEEGSIEYSEEYLHGKLHKGKLLMGIVMICSTRHPLAHNHFSILSSSQIFSMDS